MNNRLYVENLPVTATESTIRELFSRSGSVTEIKMVLDPATGRPRGRAFVTMATPELAQTALKALQSHSFEGRHLAVNMARPIEERPTGLIGQGFELDRGAGEPKPAERRPQRRPQHRTHQGPGKRGPKPSANGNRARGPR